MHNDILKIAITGHIDHGKSTLIGRLLMATHSLPKDKQKEIKKIAKEFGKDTELAWIVDQLKEERENNITIETTEIFLKTRKRSYCLIDTPGHLEFIKNMLTGASHADAALLIIDADKGVQEQTRRHAYLIKLLALNNVIVVINKMDLIDYDQGKFQEIKEEMTSFLKNLNIDMAYLLPVSAKEGVNILRPSHHMSWYQGPALLPTMDSLKIRKERGRHLSLRLPIQDVYKIADEDILVGRITSGSLKRREKIVLLPSRNKSVINKIKIYGEKRNRARPQESIGITLSPALTARRGDIVCSQDDIVVLANGFKGNIFWLSDVPLKKNETITIRCATQECDVLVENIEKRIDPSTLEILEEDAPELKINEAGIINLKLSVPAVIEKFHDIPELGRYVVERNRSFQGAGTVIEKY